MLWHYQKNDVKGLPEEVAYFVYIITYNDGKKYIGMKSVWTTRRLKPLKGMRVNAKRTKLTESKWKSYRGSSKLSKGKIISDKEILYLCSNKRTATYLEAKTIMCSDAMFKDEYLNANCLGKFFDNALGGLI